MQNKTISAFIDSPHIKGARVFVFSGHAGSGKTEIAVNFALELARSAPTAIVDFDIINPYFRTADARAALEAAGVRLVAPQFAGTNVDVPALPGEINRLFDDPGAYAIFDVGGDDLGAKAVSSFRDAFAAAGARHFFVLNARRPMTSTIGKAERAFHEIQASARIPYDAIVANTHLLGETTVEDLMEGLDAALGLAERVGLGVAFCPMMLPANTADAAQNDTSAQHAANAADYANAANAAFLGRLSALGIPALPLRKHIVMEYR